MFTSRTYEDIIFEKTHRFQVEEVFLVDAATPRARFPSPVAIPPATPPPRRVTAPSSASPSQLRDDERQNPRILRTPRPAQRHRPQRPPRHPRWPSSAASPSELVLADLEFALRRIEDHFREQFQQEGSALLYTLQPFLEDCLLIQAPASAA